MLHNRSNHSGERGMADTARAVFGTAVASLFLLAVVPTDAPAQPIPLNAKVIWVHEPRVVLVAADSLVIGEGYLLTFLSRKKTVATAVGTAVLREGLTAP